MSELKRRQVGGNPEKVQLPSVWNNGTSKTSKSQLILDQVKAWFAERSDSFPLGEDDVAVSIIQNSLSQLPETKHEIGAIAAASILLMNGLDTELALVRKKHLAVYFGVSSAAVSDCKKELKDSFFASLDKTCILVAGPKNRRVLVDARLDHSFLLQAFAFKNPSDRKALTIVDQKSREVHHLLPDAIYRIVRVPDKRL